MGSNFSRLFRLIFSTDIILPLMVIIFYIASLVFAKRAIPTSEELIAHFASLYARYGYEIIFIGALLEALALTNFFVPGALAVALGAIFARSGQVDLSLAVISAASGGMVGFIIDYFLGYFGFSAFLNKFGFKEILAKFRKQLEQSGTRTFVLGFVHPNIGSFVALVAGALKMNFVSFLLLASLSTLAWVSFWALLIFALGEVFLVLLTKYIWVVLIFVVSVWILTFLYSKSKRSLRLRLKS